MGSNKIIVTTTINPPTEALQKYKNMEGWDLIVVGDLKTPHEAYEGWDYLSPVEQEDRYKNLSDAIGWNCIQRRNIGFVEAYKRGAEIIATVDDDNIPFAYWGTDANLIGKSISGTKFLARGPVFDPLSAVEKPYPHRGFPIQGDRKVNFVPWHETVKPNIIANLWVGEPDVDALTRLSTGYVGGVYTYPYGIRYPFFSDTISPFNSQNTILSREVIPYYFMYPGIGRYDDIWASYYVQMQGFKVAYGEATVEQKRNDHDLFKDLEDEIFGYRNTPKLLAGEDVLPDVAKRAYAAYQETLGGFGSFK